MGYGFLWGLMVLAPLTLHAQVCPAPVGPQSWHRVDPSWNTRFQLPPSPSGQTAALDILGSTIADLQGVLQRYRPATWGGTIGQLAVSGTRSQPTVFFNYERTGLSGSISGTASYCPISYVPRGDRGLCQGLRLWIDLTKNGEDLAGIVSALVIDLCLTLQNDKSLSVSTVTQILEGPRYGDHIFFVQLGPQAARLLQAQSPELVKALLATYRLRARAVP